MAHVLKFQVTNLPEYSQMIARKAGVFGQTFRAALREEAVSLCKELIARTPPFSGKALSRMGKLSWRNAEIEDMTAYQVGRRRVEKDVRRVLIGVRRTERPAARPQVFVGQTHERQAGYDPNAVEWGVLQKCEGKEAVRIWATVDGRVYGIDRERFRPSATIPEMAETHKAHRVSRGRVSLAGTRDLVVGRWRWLDMLVTSERDVRAYLKTKLRMVGQAKGGWAAGIFALGGRISRNGWVGRHANAGTAQINLNGSNPSIVLTNNSAWASGGDPERIRGAAIAGRLREIQSRIAWQFQKAWEGKLA